MHRWQCAQLWQLPHALHEQFLASPCLSLQSQKGPSRAEQGGSGSGGEIGGTYVPAHFAELQLSPTRYATYPFPNVGALNLYGGEILCRVSVNGELAVPCTRKKGENR